jgi:low temperature requirement protein LtrA
LTAGTIATSAPAAGAAAKPERRASWLELFFDLCFVVAVGAVAHTLHDEPSIEGIALFVALFIPVWWSWMEYAWYATSFPESGGFNRFVAFAAMLTVLAMATQVGAASHGDPRGVILAFVVFHAIVVALFLRASRRYPGLQGFSRACPQTCEPIRLQAHLGHPRWASRGPTLHSHKLRRL